MKTKDAKEKKFRELSEEELENVNGGLAFVACVTAEICAKQGKQLDLKTCKCY